MPAPSGLVAAVALAPAVLLSVIVCVIGGGAQASPNSAACSAGGTAQTVTGIDLDAEQLTNAHTIITVTAGRGLSSYAAIVAVDTAYTESTLHNYTTETDHDSQGLFQQRVSIYTAAVADDPVNATDAFLDRLVGIADWQDTPVGIDAQDVQISGHPERYQPNAALAAALVDQYWPTAEAAAPSPTTAASASPTTTGTASSGGPSPSPITPTDPAQAGMPAVCGAGDGAIPITGGHGGNVAGTITIPAGLVMDGSSKGDGAAQYALQQLGKPYVFGAAGPNAYDCSGLTMAAWASQGIALAHFAATQAGEGTPESTNLSQAVTGDLVLIPGSDGTAAAPGHVGMVIGSVATTVNGQPARELWLIQAPGYANLPVELTLAGNWLSGGPIVAVRHIA
ncbi:MAG: C40 family peptidase [Actinobacteria bacterium]|nr:C40 family peptidase [Actinomycetota bacterium]